MLKVMNVCGARPNFVKVAPLMRACQRSGRIAPLLVHTGQHYDENMSNLFYLNLDHNPLATPIGVLTGKVDQLDQEVRRLKHG